VSLEQIWAGWRAAYVESVAAAEAQEASGAQGAGGACVMCHAVAADEDDAAAGVVWRGELCTAVLNVFPYTSGHLLVVLNRHAAEPEELTRAEGEALWAAVTDAVVALRSAYRPDGLNIGLNLGRAAGAGYPGHLHVHVLPRWSGDTSFTTAVAGTRVIPEPLPDTWAKLRAAWRGR